MATIRKKPRAPGRRSAAESRLTRSRLIAAAEGQFARRGFSGTSVRDIAGALGIAGSSVLHHIGSKRRLYRMVLDNIAESLIDVTVPIDDPPASDALRAMLRRFAAWADANPHYVQILLREMMENPARLKDAHRLPLAAFLRRGGQAAERALGRRRDIDADMLFLIVVGAITFGQVALPSFAAARHGGAGARSLRRFAASLEGLLAAALDSSARNI